MALWARLGDGNRANAIYKGYLKEQCTASFFALCGRAMQVDGSFGVTAAVTEMLMQSQDGFIKLLPAVPDEWGTGEFKGVCARGGFELDYAWENKKIKQLKILSKAGDICRIEHKPGLKISSNGKKVNYKKLPGGILEALSRLFDEKTHVFVFPHKDKKTCQTASTFNPDAKLQFLYKHLLANGWFEDVLDCDDIDATIHSESVRKMLERGDADWKKLVPEKARRLIEERQLFGYRP